MLASELFALSQEITISGVDSCHWCSAPCDRSTLHDGPLPLPFIKSPEPTKRPSNNYICKACRVWRRTSVTVNFLDNTFRDRQSARNHSWWITKEGCWAIEKNDYQLVYNRILKPPGKFILSLKDDKITNHLQCMLPNELEELVADRPLAFTYNNIPHTYTIYELEEAIKAGDGTGTEPGVQALLRILGPYEAVEEPKKQGPGRPRLENPSKKLLTISQKL